jgi:prepilin-type N-terminal cleavage/methylation domain-containing protein
MVMHGSKRGAARRVGAFTLLELLVVLGVIALLAALGLPQIGKALAGGRRAGCVGKLHGLGGAFHAYLIDHDQVMPVAAQMPSLKLNDDPPISEALSAYASDPAAWRCPADRKSRYWAREGSSYEYHAMLGGRLVGTTFLSKRWGDSQTPVLNDYRPFHGEPEEPASMMFLFADGSVGALGHP